ncbi:MAG: hypothetical protein HOM45_04215 [Nitrosomonadales bacterium]|nr:hypothetical protein [Nitrosomonadales bacterium]
MKIYLVGGALRNKLLNLPVKDKDYVVVGSTPEQMIQKGFKPIGKDFPVFIHPKTKDEYALARTEKKIGVGYHGFKFYASPEISLEEDLKRRDLTINAIAQDEDGKIYDPYKGQIDIDKRIIRHVSDAFVEDPLRVLRAARFATLDKKFVIHKDTLNLLKKMVLSGELKSLAVERVIEEIKKGLVGKYPSKMFYYLTECGALNEIFSGINYDQKMNSNFVSLGLVIEKNIVVVSDEFKILLILLVPFFSKNFLEAGVKYRKEDEGNVLSHLKLSNAQKKVYENIKEEKDSLDNFLSLNPKEKLDCLYRLDFFRRPIITFEILNILMVLNIASNGSEKSDLLNYSDSKQQENFIKIRSKLLKNITQLLNSITDALSQTKKGYDSAMPGSEIKKLIYEERLQVLKKLAD